MAKYQKVPTEFWIEPIVREMTPADKYFYLYLLTNPNITEIGIYRIAKKQMAFELGYPIETVNLLMERFTQHHKLIRYNPTTRELAIRDWGKDYLQLGREQIISELQEVEDRSLIQFVAPSILKQEIRNLYESFFKQEELIVRKENRD